MPATGPYIPAPDGDFATWLANFEAIVAVDFAALGLTAGQAGDVTTENTAYQAAYTASQDPGTRTPVTVAAKDAARISAEAVVRPIAIQVRNNPGVSDPTKISLGLTVPSFPPVPVPIPTSFPVLDLLNATPGQHKVEYRDSDTPTSKKKPYGSINMELWAVIGTSPAPDPTGAVFLGGRTKSPFFVDLDPADTGKVITYFARWLTRTNKVGPWSSGVSMTIAF
jgi:hypothetical protein